MTEQRRREEHVGDAPVDAAWRAAASDQPPAHVDAAILAAARAEIRGHRPAREHPSRTRRWIRLRPFAAAAGVIGLSFLVVQLIPRDDLVRTPASTPEARSPVVRPQSPVSPEAPTRQRALAPAVESQPRARTEDAAPPSEALSAAKGSPAQEASPLAWARRIVALHEAGDEHAAAVELRAFRAAHPDADAHLPATLAGWAATVGNDDR